MRFLIIGDLHGQKPVVQVNKFDAIIAPGDFCSDDSRKYMFKALKERIKNSESTVQWYDLVGRNKAKEMIHKSLRDGRKVLEFLNAFNKPVYIVPGNWDWTADKGAQWKFLQENHYSSLIRGLTNINDVHCKHIETEQFNIIGHGISSGPEIPQYEEDQKKLTAQELKEKKQKYNLKMKQLSELFNKESKKPTILLSHNVPFNTPLDKINNPKSPRNGQHFGSVIARTLIEKHQPLVCIGGHIHEHFGKCNIGKTTIINAGFGSEVNTVLEIKENQIIVLEFHNNSCSS